MIPIEERCSVSVAERWIERTNHMRIKSQVKENDSIALFHFDNHGNAEQFRVLLSQADIEIPLGLNHEIVPITVGAWKRRNTDGDYVHSVSIRVSA